MNLSGKTAVVTGGAAGIGAEMVERFADLGAAVVIADIADGSAVVEAVDTDAVAVKTDVSDRESVRDLGRTVRDRFGAADILVNNAGIYAPLVPKRDRGFDEIPVDEWERVLAVNTTGTFFCCQEFIPDMMEREWGSVVNISSGVAFSGTVGYPHYVSSKGAIAPMTRALAAEVGEFGVRVNAIAPGLILSEASQQLSDEYIDNLVQAQCLKRRGRPSDVVDAVEFLTSEKSSFISGSLLHVDGGLTRR